VMSATDGKALRKVVVLPQELPSESNDRDQQFQRAMKRRQSDTGADFIHGSPVRLFSFHFLLHFLLLPSI
jgi:hypothetical protein